MPKLKLTEKEEKDRLVVGYIRKNQVVCNLSDAEVASKVHFTKRTFQNKCKRPGTFSLNELREVCKILNFSKEEKSDVL